MPQKCEKCEKKHGKRASSKIVAEVIRERNPGKESNSSPFSSEAPNSKSKRSIDPAEVFRELLEEANVCTEPASIKLASSVARGAIDGELPSFLGEKNPKRLKTEKELLERGKGIESIHVELDQYTVKELFVGLFHPSDSREKGVVYAAALGILSDSEERLNISSDSVERRRAAIVLAERTTFEVNYRENPPYVKVVVRHGNDTGEAVISGSHTNVVRVARNGELLLNNETTGSAAKEKESAKISKLTLEELYEVAERLDGDAYKLVENALKVNETSMLRAVQRDVFSLPYLKIKSYDPMVRAKKYVVATTAERMLGVRPEIIAVCGSGNQAIQLMAPVIALSKEEPKERKQLVKAIAFGCLVTQKCSLNYGVLSAACGCTQKAGPGAVAALVYYMGGSAQQVAEAIKHMLKAEATVLCEGAAKGCVDKLRAATGAVFDSAYDAMHGEYLPSEGLTKHSGEETIAAVGSIVQGLRGINEAIVRAMMASSKNTSTAQKVEETEKVLSRASLQKLAKV